MDTEAQSRLELLLGREASVRLHSSSILVCGLGGVGSWAAEAFARCGVGALTLLDFDTIKPSNLNRQLEALHSTLGQSKASVLAARLQDIAPELSIDCRNIHLSPESVEALLAEHPWSGVLDAIDERPAKLALLIGCVHHGIPVVSSMGAANKVHPECITVTDISQTTGCPFAKLMRKALKKNGIETGVQVVYSPEAPVEIPDTDALRDTPAEKRPLGSLVTMTAIFGFRAAHALLEPVMKAGALRHRGTTENKG